MSTSHKDNQVAINLTQMPFLGWKVQKINQHGKMKNLITNYSHFSHKKNNRLKSMVISCKNYKTHYKWQLIAYNHKLDNCIIQNFL
jgi:hypothetical protein